LDKNCYNYRSHEHFLVSFHKDGTATANARLARCLCVRGIKKFPRVVDRRRVKLFQCADSLTPATSTISYHWKSDKNRHNLPSQTKARISSASMHDNQKRETRGVERETKTRYCDTVTAGGCHVTGSTVCPCVRVSPFPAPSPKCVKRDVIVAVLI